MRFIELFNEISAPIKDGEALERFDKYLGESFLSPKGIEQYNKLKIELMRRKGDKGKKTFELFKTEKRKESV